jgi:hypothetical protein
MLFSQKGVSFRSMVSPRGYGCMRMGQPSSSMVMGIDKDSVDDISFPGHISGPPRGCKPVVRRVALLRAMTEGQRGLTPLWEWKVSSSGQC